MAGAGHGPPMDNELLVWFQGEATTTFGADWMSKGSSHVAATPSTTIGEQRTIEGSGHVALTRRKGGRAPCPPPVATRSLDVNLTDNSGSDDRSGTDDASASDDESGSGDEELRRK
ncbi:hypothetical protein ZEAMMB73_Zm00001d052959, partial [Zea mays]